MDTKRNLFERIDANVTRWMARWGIRLLRLSLGIVFLWFGILKLFPGLSPAQTLAGDTINILSFGIVSPQLANIILGVWECLIGLGLITGIWMRVVILLLLVQMAGTITPVFLFPAQVFARFPYAPTLEGQYIIKNLVLISAAIVIGATVRGGAVIADPDLAQQAKQKEELREKAGQ